MTLRELMEKRAALVAKMRKVNDDPQGEGGDLSDAQDKEFKELRVDLNKTDAAIERAKLIDEADRRADGSAITGDADANFDCELRNFSIVRAMAAAVGIDVDAGREREVSAELARRSGKKPQGFYVPLEVFQRRATAQEMERRILTTAAPAGGSGSNVIAEDYRGDMFIDLLRANLITERLGATVHSGLQGDVKIPRQKATGGSAWVAENAAISASDAEFNQVAMTPRHAGVIQEFSRNLLLQSSPDIEMLMRRDFAASLARAIDSAALNGGGSAAEPDGILATSGVDKTTSLSTPTWAGVLDLIDIVESGDALMGSLGFAMSPTTKKKLRTTLRAANTDSRFIMETPTELAGYQAASSTGVPNASGSPATGQIIFGNWNDLVIGYWSVIDVLVNPYESTAYSKGNVQIRGMLTADVALRHDESFAVSTDVPTS